MIMQNPEVARQLVRERQGRIHREVAESRLARLVRRARRRKPSPARSTAPQPIVQPSLPAPRTADVGDGWDDERRAEPISESDPGRTGHRAREAA